MAECKQQQHHAGAAPWDGRLNAAIIELSGGVVDSQIRALAAFETHAKGSITKQTAGGDPDTQPNQQSRSAASAAWTSHAFLAPGAPPGAVCDAALEEGDTESAWWCADGEEAESIAIRLRQFAVRQFALVERAIHGRLLTLWEGIAEGDRADLRWHFICTVRRDHAPGGAGPTHADTFDGCMVAFALAANKIQTPIFPAAHFDPPAVQQFVSAANGRDPTCRPDRIQLARAADGGERCGPQRRPRDAVVLILPGAVVRHLIQKTKKNCFDINWLLRHRFGPVSTQSTAPYRPPHTA